MPSRQSVRILIAFSLLALLLRLAELTIKGPDFHEVNVAGRLLWTGRIVAGLRVVRDEIARLQSELFEEERMRARQRVSGITLQILQLNPLFLTPVNRVIELNRRHAVVIFGAHLGEDLLNARDLHIAAGLVDHDRRRVIVKHGYVVFVRAVIALSAVAGQLDSVSPVSFDRELAAEVALIYRSHFYFRSVADNDPRRLCIRAQLSCDLNYCTFERGDLPAVLDLLARKPRVSGKVQQKIDLFDERKVDNFERELGRANVVRFDVVGNRILNIENHEREFAVVLCRLHRVGDPVFGAYFSHENLSDRRIESGERGFDLLIRAARRARSAGAHVDEHRTGGYRIVIRRVECRQPV